MAEPDDRQPHDEAIGPDAPTAGPDYAERLSTLSEAPWKRMLHVQAPYRAHLRRLDLGRTVDVGCGIGRHLPSLPPGSIGVDHNRWSIDVARDAGLNAVTDEEFFADDDLSAPETYEGLLASHLIEHLDEQDVVGILEPYVRTLHAGGRAVFITPQERGYASDATHVRFSDLDVLGDLARELGLDVRRGYSFPLPRFTGKVFTYNEFVLLAQKPWHG